MDKERKEINIGCVYVLYGGTIPTLTDMYPISKPRSLPIAPIGSPYWRMII